MSEFSVATLVKLIRKASKIRVSRSAALELGAVLEDHSIRIAKEAMKLAEHRGAKTVNEKDIRAAAAVIQK